MHQKLASNLGAGVTLVGKLVFNVLNSVVVHNQEAVDKYIMQREPGLGLVTVSNHIRWGELPLLFQSSHSNLHNDQKVVQHASDVSSEPQGLLPAVKDNSNGSCLHTPCLLAVACPVLPVHLPGTGTDRSPLPACSTLDDPFVLGAMLPWRYFLTEHQHKGVRWSLCAREICFWNPLLA